jgi:hypothetical protein
VVTAADVIRTGEVETAARKSQAATAPRFRLPDGAKTGEGTFANARAVPLLRLLRVCVTVTVRVQTTVEMRTKIERRGGLLVAALGRSPVHVIATDVVPLAAMKLVKMVTLYLYGLFQSLALNCMFYVSELLQTLF